MNMRRCSLGQQTMDPLGRQLEEGSRYLPLWRVLRRAYEHAASGKGEARHGDGRDFAAQPICTGRRRYGRGAHYAQIEKKLDEALRLPADQAIAELYGVINYAAADILGLEAELAAGGAASDEQEGRPNESC